MATTNHERVGKALDFLKDGLRPFVRLSVAEGAKTLGVSRQALSGLTSEHD
jgi:hypothetical protein